MLCAGGELLRAHLLCPRCQLLLRAGVVMLCTGSDVLWLDVEWHHGPAAGAWDVRTRRWRFRSDRIRFRGFWCRAMAAPALHIAQARGFCIVRFEFYKQPERMNVMSSAKKGSVAVDQARQLLRSECARSMSAGHYTVRVRITQTNGEPVGAGFYFHGPKGWKKQPEQITDRKLVQGLAETLEMLVTKEHGDECLVRRSKASDGYDTDLQFHPDRFANRLGAKLESVLEGVLFRDSHDSKKDKRSSIRTPKQAAGRKASAGRTPRQAAGRKGSSIRAPRQGTGRKSR